MSFHNTLRASLIPPPWAPLPGRSVARVSSAAAVRTTTISHAIYRRIPAVIYSAAAEAIALFAKLQCCRKYVISLRNFPSFRQIPRR